MELNIAVVDDTLSDVVRLKNFIRNWSCGCACEVGIIQSYASGEEMLKDFVPKVFQIVFMDIIMNNLNGIETARQLRQEDTELLIVFTTTSDEYAFQAFPVHPFDYVLKPYSMKRVEQILDEAVRVLSATDPAVTVRAAHSEYTIPMRLVSAIASQGHTVEITLTNGKRILSTMKFKEVEKLFAEDSHFLLCNRGIILNMSQISAQEKGVFVMKNGTRFPIRVNGQAKIKAAFSQYLINSMRAGELYRKGAADE